MATNIQTNCCQLIRATVRMAEHAIVSKHVNAHAVTLVYDANKTYVDNRVFAAHVSNQSLDTSTTHKPNSVKHLNSADVKAIRTILAALTHATTTAWVIKRQLIESNLNITFSKHSNQTHQNALDLFPFFILFFFYSNSNFWFFI